MFGGRRRGLEQIRPGRQRHRAEIKVLFFSVVVDTLVVVLDAGVVVDELVVALEAVVVVVGELVVAVVALVVVVVDALAEVVDTSVEESSAVLFSDEGEGSILYVLLCTVFMLFKFCRFNLNPAKSVVKVLSAETFATVVESSNVTLSKEKSRSLMSGTVKRELASSGKQTEPPSQPKISFKYTVVLRTFTCPHM